MQRDQLKKAHSFLKDKVHQTPTLISHNLNHHFGYQLFFKAENFQKVGAFKARGASFAVGQLSEEDKKNGVATHSSGNHAQALALAAQRENLPAYIVMPRNAPQVKQRAVAGYGAEIILCEPTLAARESTLEEVIQKTGATAIHPYNHPDVITGQSTVLQELLAQAPELDRLLVPLGGGGLLSGCLLAAQAFAPQLKIYGIEPLGADDAYRSLKSGVWQASENPSTIADGLLTSTGSLTWPIIQKHVTDILRVNEADIVSAMRLIWERLKIVIEPSAAVGLAALFQKPFPTNEKIGLILTGGNIDLEKLPF